MKNELEEEKTELTYAKDKARKTNFSFNVVQIENEIKELREQLEESNKQIKVLKEENEKLNAQNKEKEMEASLSSTNVNLIFVNSLLKNVYSLNQN